MMQLSKTEYLMFLKHPAWLWLKKHDKSKLPVVGDSLQAMFDDGNLFEEYAEKLFPHAVSLGFNNYDEYRTLPARTELALDRGATTIFQGRFEAGSITCIVDVLQKVNENEFDLYEIKASTHVKEEHILDLAFQTIVLENAGFKIRKMYVIYVNKDYLRTGEIDINKITTQTDVTQEVRDHIEETKGEIKKAISVMESSIPPDFSPRHVGLRALDEWMAIYEVMYPHTHTHDIYKLTRLNPELIGEFEDLGVKLISDIPDSVNLNSKQKIQIKVTKDNNRIIDKLKIQEFIAQMIYPLYFFDYETFSNVIPPFDKIHPYQQVTFQYSLHKIDAEGIMTHKEYIHTTNSNPCIHLLEQLKKDIGDKGTVLVWYESFEKGRNTELGEMFPEYTQFMSELNARIIDLMIPFSNDWFVDKDFFGSASLKKVLPVLISDLSYDKLAIQEGGTASRTWKEMVFEGKYQDKKEELTKQLLEYCHMDTLAMVQLFKFLQTEIS